MAGDFYLKKEYWDDADDIAAVRIHYTTALFGEAPDWGLSEARPMAANEQLRSGVGAFSRYGPPAPVRPQFTHPRLRKKVIKMPGNLWDAAAGAWTPEYNLHYFYEIARAGRTEYSPIYTDEIRTRDLLYVSADRRISGACAYWSIGDWDAPQFNPTEELRFLARHGEDHPLHQFKFYGAEDKDAWNDAKARLLNAEFPYPRRFWTRIQAPVGATVNLMFHTGTDWDRPEHERWEAYILEQSFVMGRDMAPLFEAPLGAAGLTVEAIRPEIPPLRRVVPGAAPAAPAAAPAAAREVAPVLVASR